MPWDFPWKKKRKVWKEGTQYFYDCPCGHSWSYTVYSIWGHVYNTTFCKWCNRNVESYGKMTKREVKDLVEVLR